MAFKIIYDANADRMRLTLKPDGQDNKLFWLNRAQCLSLLARLAVASKSMDIMLKAIKPMSAVPPRPRKDFGADDPTPEGLMDIRLRRDGEWLKVVFLQSKGQGIGLSLKPEGVTKIHHLLATEATKAGWDPIAGLNRLKAIAKARQAQKKSAMQ